LPITFRLPEGECPAAPGWTRPGRSLALRATKRLSRLGTRRGPGRPTSPPFAPRKPEPECRGRRSGSRSRPSEPRPLRSHRHHSRPHTPACTQACPDPKSPHSLPNPFLMALLTVYHKFAILGGGVARKRPAVRRAKSSSTSGFKIFFGTQIFFHCARSFGVIASLPRRVGPICSGRSRVPPREGRPALTAVFGGGGARRAGGRRPSCRARRPPPGIPGRSSAYRSIAKPGSSLTTCQICQPWRKCGLRYPAALGLSEIRPESGS
jgi:hypothetical protein